RACELSENLTTPNLSRSSFALHGRAIQAISICTISDPGALPDSSLSAASASSDVNDLNRSNIITGVQSPRWYRRILYSELNEILPGRGGGPGMRPERPWVVSCVLKIIERNKI